MKEISSQSRDLMGRKINIIQISILFQFLFLFFFTREMNAYRITSGPSFSFGKCCGFLNQRNMEGSKYQDSLGGIVPRKFVSGILNLDNSIEFSGSILTNFQMDSSDGKRTIGLPSLALFAKRGRGRPPKSSNSNISKRINNYRRSHFNEGANQDDESNVLHAAVNSQRQRGNIQTGRRNGTMFVSSISGNQSDHSVDLVDKIKDADNFQEKNNKNVINFSSSTSSQLLSPAWKPSTEAKSNKINFYEPLKNNNFEKDFPSQKGIMFPTMATELVNDDPVWASMRQVAEEEARKEPVLSSYLHSTILNHRSLESAVAFHMANKLATSAMIGTQVQSLFMQCFDASGPISYNNNNPQQANYNNERLIYGNQRDNILSPYTETNTDYSMNYNNDMINSMQPTYHTNFKQSIRDDLQAVLDRDPACRSYLDALLYFKGFQALQTHRVAHWLWRSGRDTLAFYFQSQMNQIFQIDIHPAARIGTGVFLDHGTGVVIGETAVIGHNVSMLHSVTLGGSGRKHVDRHPKIGNGVLLGAGASVLGNVHVGAGSLVGACSLVLEPIPPHSVAVGVPAKIVGEAKENPSQSMRHTSVIGSAALGVGSDEENADFVI